MSEDLPFGSRGGMAIRHYFPLDGEYIIRVRLQKNTRDYIRGLGERHDLDVRLDGSRVKLFAVGGEHLAKSGPIFTGADANQLGEAEQEYYERHADDNLEVRFPAKAGTHLVAAAFLDQTAMPEGAFRRRMTQPDFAQYKGGDPAVDSLSISGPYNATAVQNTPPRRNIFVCYPAKAGEEQRCAKQILSTLAHRAYRRPLTHGDIEMLLGIYEVGSSTGGFEAGIQAALERILVGPEFLFRIERDPPGISPGIAYRISDVELASRLAFFIWGSIPDDELLSLAERGKLKEPATLGQQVRRMLGDARSKSLVNDFSEEWLHVRNLHAVKPDPQVFDDFDENLREAFQLETQLFVQSVLREDRSVMDLLDADYTYLNERLARHYGIANVYGSHFRRVKLTDEHRGGLLGQGSILTVTSYANRTSPVLRGKWVLDNILGSPPPPPPNVPSLKDNGENGQMLTMRQRMEQHRANPVCAGCHSRMDPLGFALENFDALGKWRTVEANNSIDPSGVLPDGTKFEGPAGLRKVLLSKQEEFVSTMTERLLIYALGRGLDYNDAPAIRKILREAAGNDYRWSSLILGIAKSTPFQMRRSAEP
jgi:hypothetical protein